MIIIELLILDGGYKGWMKDNRPHRDNQSPALIFRGKKFWFKNGACLKQE